MYLLLVPINPTSNDSRYRFACKSLFFSTIEAAEAFRGADRSVGPDCGVTIHRWLGEVRDGAPFFAGDPLPSSALFLALPHHGAGCRDEHRPLLKLAEEVIGQGVPLDALTGVDSGNPDDWEIDGSARGEMLSVTIRCAFDSEGCRIWWADDSCQDDGNPWPAGVTADDVTEAANEYANATSDPDDDAEEGDEGDTCYVAVFDGEVIGCYDDPYEAEEAINDWLSESRRGYPWAWNWAYYLGERSADSPVAQAVKAAGYTVATQTATGYLFAGIDSGGYDFDSAHKAPLGAALSHLWFQLIDGAIPVGPAL